MIVSDYSYRNDKKCERPHELDPVASPNAVKLRSRFCPHQSASIRLIHGSLILNLAIFRIYPYKAKAMFLCRAGEMDSRHDKDKNHLRKMQRGVMKKSWGQSTRRKGTSLRALMFNTIGNSYQKFVISIIITIFAKRE